MLPNKKFKSKKKIGNSVWFYFNFMVFQAFLSPLLAIKFQIEIAEYNVFVHSSIKTTDI